MIPCCEGLDWAAKGQKSSPGCPPRMQGDAPPPRSHPASSPVARVTPARWIRRAGPVVWPGGCAQCDLWFQAGVTASSGAGSDSWRVRPENLSCQGQSFLVRLVQISPGTPSSCGDPSSVSLDSALIGLLMASRMACRAKIAAAADLAACDHPGTAVGDTADSGHCIGERECGAQGGARPVQRRAGPGIRSRYGAPHPAHR